MAEIALATEFAVSRSPQLSNSNLLNFMIEKQPQEADGQAPLFGCPGAMTHCVTGDGPHRGAWDFNGKPYFVSGTELWTMDRDGSNATLLGTGIGGTGMVDMSDNGTQLCIVNGVNGWIYTIADGLVLITDSAFYPADTVTYMDGYFIFDRKGTNQWFISALLQDGGGLVYNGLDYASAEAQPGFVTGTAQNLQLLFIFCTAHIELWYDAGTANFPFQRYTGGVINFGCISPSTIIKQDGALFFLGVDHTFYRLQANVCTRVSTHALETVLTQSKDITTAFCFTYSWEGHKIIVLNLPDLDRSFAYDISTTLWHERDSVDPMFRALGAWRFNTAVTVYDDVFLGDRLSGQVGMIDWNVYSELGYPMRGLVHSANIHKDRKRVFCSRFELDVEAGVGLTELPQQGDNPMVMLRRSVDGGKTWSLPQQWRSMGKIGEYTKRLRWMRQGQGRRIMWEVIITDPIPRTIIGAYVDLSEGM